MLPFLRAIGDTDELVGSWSLTRDEPRRFRLTVDSVGLYECEQHALDVAEIIAPRLVPASCSMIGVPDLTAVLRKDLTSRWRARVSLQLSA